MAAVSNQAPGQLDQNFGGDALTLKPESYMSMVWRRFRRHKLAMAGLCFLLLMYLVAVFAPYIATQSYRHTDPPNRLQAPSQEHWMGTDNIGRDLFSRVIWGSRISLSVGFVAAGVAVLLGTVIGALAGYFGGAIDNILMRFTEIVMSFPTFFLLITIVSIVERSIFNIMLVIGLTSWPGLARMVRGQFLSLREQEFVLAARALGASNARIIFRHILPNAMAPVIVSATLRIGGAILTESGLSFLGLGVQEPFPSWGNIINTGRTFLRQAPWITAFPGIFIFLTVLSFNYVGDGLRDALDPRLKD
ncbi:MAG: oligopeptide ABC transporter permease [Bacillota bacterium]|jgi:peptide/nickel transport system permease protein|nr:ABC transporter permease [Candidatus Fermentithermobacillaceae bacterium]